MKLPRLLLATATLLLLPLAAHAVPITFEFTGTATTTTGIWAGEGTAVTGSYTYDSGLSPTLNSGTINTFLSNNPANAGLAYNLTINLGNEQFIADTIGASPFFNFGLFDLGSDQYSFTVVAPGVSAGLKLIGGTTGISALNGSVPMTPPDPGLFNIARGNVGTDLVFTITSITVPDGGDDTIIPEPSAALVFGIGALIVGGRVRGRRRP